MIQMQKWHDCHRHIITNEREHGSVQLDIPKPEYRTLDFEGRAYGFINSLWVDEAYRRHGVGDRLLRFIEMEAKTSGIHVVCLEWNNRDTPEWVLHWYERRGYKEKEFGKHGSLLVKYL